jgi:uncharacterized protein YihD (DUF1040 family)
MRDPARIDRVIELLREVWERYPDQRFGQLISNLLRESGSDALWITEDDEWELWLTQLVEHEHEL